MKTAFLRAASLAALLAAAALPAHAADKAPPVTNGVAVALNAAQKATAEKNFPEALAQIDKARAAKKTDYDQLKIEEVLLGVTIGQGDLAGAATAAEAAAAVPNIPDAEKGPVYSNALMLSLNQQHNDKALEYSKNLQALNVTDDHTLMMMATAYFNAKDYPSAIATSQKAIASAKAANKPADRQVYVILRNAYVGNNDQAGARAALEQSILATNSSDDWTQLIDVGLGTQGLRDLDAIYLGRLLVATKATVDPTQADIIGETAGRLTFYGDALAMKEHGGTKFPDPTAKAAADKAALPKLVAQAQAAKSGLLAAKIAQAQYSYGMFADAEASARLAISKGGDPDVSEPQMVLAQSLASQGKYQDAIAAFKAVTGGSPATTRAAELWILYCNVQLSPPPAAATATK